MHGKRIKKTRSLLQLPKLPLAKATPCETDDVLWILQPMHFLLRCFAPVPYRIKKIDGVLQGTTTKHNAFYYMVYSAICAVTMTGGIATQNQNVIEYTITQTNVVATNIILVSFYSQRKNIIKTLNKIVKLNRRLTKMGLQIRHNFYSRLLWACLPVHVFLMVAVRRLDFRQFSATENFSYLTRLFAALIRVFYFYYVVLCILLTDQMLKKLNDFLGETLQLEGSELRISRMRAGRILYSKIWTIARCLNLSYNIPIIIICGTSFMNSTSSLYDWWKNSSSYTTSETVQWTIIHAVKLIILSLACDSAMREGEKVAEMLRHLYEKSCDSKQEKATMFQFLMQVMHEKIEYWACELFPINKSFICSAIVAGTTYSILLVQLGDKTVTPNGPANSIN